MSVRLITALVEAETRGESRDDFARRLGIAVEHLDSLTKEYELVNGVDSWNKLIIEKRAQLDTMGANWDELERVALQRLTEHTNAGRVTTVGELLTIARIANQAARRGGFVPRPVTPQGDLRFGATLPSGDGGVIRLELTRTAAKQVESHAEKLGELIEVPFERVASPVELRQIVDAAEEENES